MPANALHILDNGAMHCDLTWLLLQPGLELSDIGT
jgi:hypothetical protein